MISLLKKHLTYRLRIVSTWACCFTNETILYFIYLTKINCHIIEITVWNIQKIQMKKFLISYAASLLTFIIIWFLITYISDPSHSYQNDLPNIVGFIMILIIFGSILNLVVCLIGEVLYRNIKQCKKLRFWIPVFIGIAVIYILIRFLFTITGAYSSSLITPIIMGSLAFYLVRRKI